MMSKIKISDVIKRLQVMKRLHGDLEMWSSRDDEGIEYNACVFGPGIISIVNDAVKDGSAEWCDLADEDFAIDETAYTKVCCIN
jgi:glycerol-3-phosphate responsive antiterminator